MLTPYLSRWNLTPDGEPIVTRTSRLLPVRRHEIPAMLRLATEAEERAGGLLMRWWDGDGAARVLAQDDAAILLERAQGARSLADLARHGHDDEATRIIGAAVARLHAPRAKPPPELIPLERRFRQLAPAAATHGGILIASAAAARALLASPRDPGVLHGDIHHDNILDFGARGWLAIDPKGLHGERGFDWANLFCNPDHETALRQLSHRIAIVSVVAGLERRRLLQWILAWAGLSAAWLIADGLPPETRLTIAERAAAELAR